MFGFGHIFDIFVLLVLALLVFGPRKMIELGSSVGKALRELRGQFKDIPGIGGGGLSSLLGEDEPRRTPFSTMSQFAQNLTVEARDEASSTAAETASVPGAAPILEGSVVSNAPSAEGVAVVEVPTVEGSVTGVERHSTD
jgi:hypothetical protein